MNTKPKLLIATDNFLPRWDGIARFLKEIIPILIKDYDVTVLAPNYGKFKPVKYNLVRIKKSKMSIGDYTSAKFSLKTIRKEIKKSDIVFTQTIGPIGIPAIMYAKKYHKKIATYIHSVEWELVPMATNNIILRRFSYPVMKLLTSYIYSKPNLLIVPSPFLADELTWRGINTRKTVATLGVNCEVFKPYKERMEDEKKKIDKIKKELNLENSFIVGNHGRIANEKDLITLLRAFNWFKRKNKNSKLIIIGDGVQHIKHKLEQTKDCIVLSAKDDVQYYLNLLDVYVTASLTETTSLTTLEAMATGLPIISTPVGFIKEYIKHKKNGLLFKPKNSFDLYKKIEYIKKDNDRAKLLGIKARETVLEKFKWSETAKKISEAIQTIK